MIPLLKKKLNKSEFDIHDFDERGIPVNVDKKWRQKETKHWLAVGYKNSKKNISTIISGISIPDEVLEILDRRRSINIKFCFLNHTNQQIKERLQRRFESKVNRQELKKVFDIKPEEFIKNNLKFATKVRKMAKDHKVYIINTTQDTPNQTANKIIKWLY